MRAFALLALALALVACSSAPAAPEPTPAAPAEAASSPEAPAPAPAPTPPTAPAACDVVTPRTVPLELAVLPAAGATPFTDALSRAHRTIRVMVYEMGTGPILDALEAKARAGVDVRVILDVVQRRTNQKYIDRLTAAGARAIWSDPGFWYMHAKVMIADEAEAVISTGNYAAFRMDVERNFAVRDADPADVGVLVRLFDADFARLSPDLSCTRLVVSPVNSRARITELIGSAKTEVVVESMQLADRDVRDALAARTAAGVDVRVILADPSWVATNTDAAAFLASHGIAARWMKSPAVHVKAIAVDGETAYVGSENLSYTSLSKNREVGVVATEPANVASVRATFEADWATATAF